MKESKFIKTVQTIAFALIIGVTTFVVVILTVMEVEFHFNADFETDTMLMIAAILTAASIFMSKFMYMQQFKNIRDLSLIQKRSKYQTAVIILMALLEGPALFSAAQLMLSGNLIYLIIIVISLLLMLFSFPTGFKFENDCQLTKEEKLELEEQ